MRLLKGLAYLLLTIGILAFLIFGLNWDSFDTLFRNQDGLAEGSEWVDKTYSLEGLVEFMALHPEHVSVVSYEVAKPDTGIYYRADEPHTMASLANVFLAIEYTRLVEHGEWNPEEIVQIDNINKYQLPDIDRTTHEDALKVLEDKGILINGELTLDQVVATMIEYNDPTFADYLYDRIGYDQLTALIQSLGLEHTETPLPYSGMYISISPHVFNRDFDVHWDSLSSIDRGQFASQAIAHSQKYVQDANYRGKIMDIFQEGDGLNLRFTQERDLYRFFPTSTARDLSSVMARLMNKNLINQNVSEHLWQLMDWPLDQQQLTNDFENYAALYDNRMGILNGIDAGISAYTGKETVQTVFFDQLPVAFWLHMSSNYMHQDYQQRLIWDPALYMTSKRAFAETTDSLHTLSSSQQSQ